MEDEFLVTKNDKVLIEQKKLNDFGDKKGCVDELKCVTGLHSLKKTISISLVLSLFDIIKSLYQKTSLYSFWY